MKPLDLTKPLESCDPERPLIGQPGLFKDFFRGFYSEGASAFPCAWSPAGAALSNVGTIRVSPDIRNVPEVEVMWAAGGNLHTSAWYKSKDTIRDIVNSLTYYTTIIRRTRRLDADGKQVGPAEYVEEEV